MSRPQKTAPPRWTVRSVLDAARGLLERAGVPEARLDADLLLAHALGKKRLDLYLIMDRPLSEAERAAYRPLIQARCRRVPVGYLTGRRPFFTVELAVTEAVLLPRPETELLVEVALDVLKARETPALVADVGTGSGAIAIAVASMGKETVEHLYATDRSPEALAVARGNVATNEVADRVTLLEGDLLEPLREAGLAGRLGLLLSNPPYVAESARAGLAPELAHEPAMALFAGSDGLDCLRPLIAGAGALLEPGGTLLFEIGFDQGDAVTALARDAGLTDVEVRPDLAGHDRLLVARRSHG